MLRRMKDLKGLAIGATDGDIGEASDFIFDDSAWTIRYLVADTNRWLPGRKVLLAAAQVAAEEGDPPALRLALTREEVRASPPLEADAPVSRHYEAELRRHYGAADYWLGTDRPSQPMPAGVVEAEGRVDWNLRSTDEMTGYHVGARDGPIGRIEDFLLDASGWAIRYLVVGTGGWWSGRQILLVPAAASGVNWGERTAEVDLTREQIRNGPEFDPSVCVDRAFEERYFGYYGYPVYW